MEQFLFPLLSLLESRRQAIKSNHEPWGIWNRMRYCRWMQMHHKEPFRRAKRFKALISSGNLSVDSVVFTLVLPKQSVSPFYLRTHFIPSLSCRTWAAPGPVWSGLPGSRPCLPESQTDWKETGNTEHETWNLLRNIKMCICNLAPSNWFTNKPKRYREKERIWGCQRSRHHYFTAEGHYMFSALCILWV